MSTVPDRSAWRQGNAEALVLQRRDGVADGDRPGELAGEALVAANRFDMPVVRREAGEVRDGIGGSG